MYPTKTKSWADLRSAAGGGAAADGSRMDRAWVHRVWDRWALASVAPSGKALTGAALLNYLPDRPSRMLSLLVAQQGLSLHPAEVHPFADGVRSNRLHTDFFWLGSRKYLVTSVHENLYCARQVNTNNPNGEGAIVARFPSFILITTYEGSVGAASKAMSATDSLIELLS